MVSIPKRNFLFYSSKHILKEEKFRLWHIYFWFLISKSHFLFLLKCPTWVSAPWLPLPGLGNTTQKILKANIIILGLPFPGLQSNNSVLICQFSDVFRQHWNVRDFLINLSMSWSNLPWPSYLSVNKPLATSQIEKLPAVFVTLPKPHSRKSNNIFLICLIWQNNINLFDCI